jgi:hypothetical protein
VNAEPGSGWAILGDHQDLPDGYEAWSLVIADSDLHGRLRPSLIAPNAEYALDEDQVRVSPAALISIIPVRHPLWSADDGPGRPEVCLIGPVLLGLSVVAIAGETAWSEHGG